METLAVMFANRHGDAPAPDFGGPFALVAVIVTLGAFTILGANRKNRDETDDSAKSKGETPKVWRKVGGTVCRAGNAERGSGRFEILDAHWDLPVKTLDLEGK